MTSYCGAANVSCLSGVPDSWRRICFTRGMSELSGSSGLVGKLRQAAAAAVDSLRRNRLSQQVCRGRVMIVKARTAAGRWIAKLANAFFRAARVPIQYWTDTRDWQRWEVRWFRRLNRRFEAAAVGPDAVREEKLPGDSLWDHMMRGTLRRGMLRAAGREFRRAHAIWSDEFGGPWSHGDASMTNVIYDPAPDRAWLIDFEIVHDKRLPPVARHADDLLSFLCDLVGFVPERRWMPYALAFLGSYGDPPVLDELRRRLVPRRGIGWIWWKVRTNWVDSNKIMRRFKRLRRMMGQDA